MKIQNARSLSPALIAHLERVAWGFETGVRYRILEREAMLKTILPFGEFHLLNDQESLIGTLFALRKKILLGKDLVVEAQYETLLSVVPEDHGKGHAKALIRSACTEENQRKLHYAYIEEKNSPSASAFKALGYECFGRFMALTFNRLSPALSARAVLISPEDIPSMKTALSDLYRDHIFTDFDASFQPDHFWVLRDQGHSVAGVQIEEEVWSITSMPGFEGWLAVHGLPHIPLLNKILNPTLIPVLKLGNLYVPEGRENEFMELVLHLTGHYRKKLALAYLDPRSPVTQRLKRNVRFGLFNPLFETPVNIWTRFQGLTANEIAAFKERPMVVSPLDIS